MARSSIHSPLEDYRKTITLNDGSAVGFRTIGGADAGGLHSLFQRSSSNTIYLRFHRAPTEVSTEEVSRFCRVDCDDTVALVATMGDGPDEKIVADGRYYRLPKVDAAEFALIVEDAHQGKGIGTHLLEELVSIARHKGIRHLEAEVLAENQRMMSVVRNRGFHVSQGLEAGVFRVVLGIGPTRLVEESAAEEEKVATIASLRAFLRPRSIAVIGASQAEGKVGGNLFRNILRQGFSGALYPVNPNAEVVASVKAYPNVFDVPGELDLAVVTVPADSVLKVVRECGRRGVRSVVVISAGFGESGPTGRDRQEMVLDAARSHGMLLVGPNCMGIINTDPQVNMNATLSSAFPPVGNVALCSQGGTLAIAILEHARSLNIGLSSFISLGNRADISSNDLLQYWEEDPATRVILLYLESFGNPRKFARIARRVSAAKPIVVVKSGRMPAGSRAAESRSSALASAVAPSEDLFRQAGIVRVDTMEELFDVANLLSQQPLPRGRKVAILTNASGPAVLTAYACSAMGLELPSVSDKTLSGLRELLPHCPNVANPIDMTAEATAEQYGRALQLLADDSHVDTVIVIFIPPVVVEPEPVARAIQSAAPMFREKGKTLLASFMGRRGPCIQPCPNDDSAGQVPCFTFPESTATALSRACEYSEWLRKPRGVIPELTGVDRDRAAAVVDSALERISDRPLWLDIASVLGLLDAYGIRVARSATAATAREAARAARDIGFPVAVKLLSDTIVAQRTDFGGVVLDVRSQKQVEQAFSQIRERLANMGREDEMQGVTVQEMIAGGVEAIVGVTQDSSFGPLVLFGAGGIYTELFKDVAFRIHPLADVDARDMVRSVKAYQFLEGWRGAEPADVEAIEELLLRVSAMLGDLPRIAEMDLNPVKVLARDNGYAVIDARVLLT